MARPRLLTLLAAALAVGVLAPMPSASAAPGDLDTTFGGGDGIATFDRGDSDAAQKILVQPNGKVLVAGQAGDFPDTDLLLARYNANGTKDTTFGGGDGVVTVDFLAFDDMWGLNRMSDGRIVVAGYAEDAADTFDHVAVARFTSNGVLDHTFSGDGKVTTAIPGYSFTDAWRSVVQPNGKVVVVGEAEMTPGGDGDIFAVRYQENGTLDPAFSGDGIFTFDLGGDDGAWDVQLLGNGGTLLAGWSDAPSEGRIALVWLTSSGAIDHGEGGGDGKSVVDLVPDNSDEIARAVFVLSSGKLLVAGDADKAVGPGSPGDVIIARLNANGLRDNTFGGGDAVVGSDSNADESVFGARRKSNGKVVVAGFADFGFFVARLKPNGSRDSTFGANGFAKTFPPTSRANDVEILGSGKIVVAGSVNNDALTVRLLG